MLVPSEQTPNITFHFSAPGHDLKLSTFVETAVQTEKLISEFSSTFFNGELRFEIRILAPEPGSFKSRLAVVGVTLTLMWGFVESDVGAGFVEGLTGKAPSEWSMEIGEQIRNAVDADSDFEGAIGEPQIQQAVCNRIVAEIAKSFLEKEESELKDSGISKSEFRGMFEARNEFFLSCAQDEDIAGLGFSEESEFPIDRRGFLLRQVTLPPRNDEEEPWNTELATITVTSPNWDRTDKQRLWKGKDANGATVYFSIEDQEFWDLIESKEIAIETYDTIVVQWALKVIGDRARDRRVVRVLKFNDTQLAEPLSDDALTSILGSFAEREFDQSDLF